MKRAIRLACVATLLLVALVNGATPSSAGGAVMNPGNGHYYSLALWEGISWAGASEQAALMNLSGDCVGYLATVTSPEENAFLVDAFGEQVGANGYGFWLGGFQEAGVSPADAGWQWVTGEPWGYTNWFPGEPSDAYGPGSEQHLDALNAGLLWNDEDNLNNIRGFIVECAPLSITVAIDIRPASASNIISLSRDGVVPVAILTNRDFDASTVDPATVLLAGAAPVHWAMLDIEFDGDLDLRLQFETADLDLDPKTSVATLTGRTFSGKRIRGSDSVIVVP